MLSVAKYSQTVTAGVQRLLTLPAMVGSDTQVYGELVLWNKHSSLYSWLSTFEPSLHSIRPCSR